MPFVHTDDTLEKEPPISAVSAAKLPRLAFAHGGDPHLWSTWKYPHHFVYAPRNIGGDGKYIDGTLLVHRDMLWHAYAASKRDDAAVAHKHLQTHRANMTPDPIDRPHGR